MSSLRFAFLSGVAAFGLSFAAGCDSAEPTAPPPPPAPTDFKPNPADIGKAVPGSSSTKGGSDSGGDTTRPRAK